MKNGDGEVIAGIITRLTKKGDPKLYKNTWVGESYSKADLLDDLRLAHIVKERT